MSQGIDSLRKIAVIGGGTAGCLAAANVSRLLPPGEFELHHIYDSRIPVIGVGEGSWPGLVTELHRLTELPHEVVQRRLQGTRKYGISYEGWGRRKRNFIHYFAPQEVSYAYHLSADLLGELLRESTNALQIDAKVLNIAKKDGGAEVAFEGRRAERYDLVFDARGFPRQRDSERHIDISFIPTNKAIIRRCPAIIAEEPGKAVAQHTYTRAIARPHGWVFVIPLTAHTSYGYVYNKDISSQEQVEADFDELLETDGVAEFEQRAVIAFPNFVHRRIYDGAIARVGNAAAFMEPLEATAIVFAELQIGMILKLRYERAPEFHASDVPLVNRFLINYVLCCGLFVGWHYGYGSIYDSEFWRYARDVAWPRYRTAVDPANVDCPALRKFDEMFELLRRPFIDESEHERKCGFMVSSWAQMAQGLGRLVKRRVDATESLLLKAAEDADFRERLLANPRAAIEKELGAALAEGHKIHVHEETRGATHLVLPPRAEYNAAEREAARKGLTSLAFLRETMHDPAPPLRPPAFGGARAAAIAAGPEALAAAGRESIRRGLEFLESMIDENGAWRCVRFSTTDPDIPRHYEKPPFISAFCVLALERCGAARARSMRAAAKAYLADTSEYPGFWRYYRHLPLDLDSTALCSLVAGDHPWIALRRNVPRILENRDEEGRFLTWLHAEDEPDVAAPFRIEADPVVNANVIAYLGDHPETRPAQRWLEALIAEDRLAGSSKWYPDPVALHYAVARAMDRARPALESLRPILAERILGLRDENGEFGDLLGTAQAVSALHRLGNLDRIDGKKTLKMLIDSQRDDGSWPELLAFGDLQLKWGTAGGIGHGSESVTSAFCIEAAELLLAMPALR